MPPPSSPLPSLPSLSNLDRAFITYYAVSAALFYIILGRFSSPNKRLKDVRLKDLEKIDIQSQQSQDDKPAPTTTSSPERAKAGLKRKLSFLQTTVTLHNPFMNLTWELPQSERLKCALCSPLLLPPRIVLLLISVLGAYSFGTLSAIGADLDKPLPWWRIQVQKPMKFFGRGILLALGFHWIKTKGRKASPAQAPIVVSNHVSFCEAIYLPGRLLSMAVSRRENAQIPIFGAMMRHVQCIFVSRTDKDSRTTVANEILKRTKTERGRWHRQLLIFPEGTTTNGSAIISFKVGAFVPGVSVQPVAVKYNSNETCDPSWVSGGPAPGEILFKLLCQPHNSMTVSFLPVYEPSEEEQKDPVLYANNVRRAIANELGVQPSSHTFDDVLLLMEAKKLGYKGGLKECITELKNMRKILEIDLPRAKEHLTKFAEHDKQKKGGLTYPEFLSAFGSKDTEELRSLFNVLDVKDRGVIDIVSYISGIMLLNEQGNGDGFDGAMKLVFKTFDSSGEGRLSKEDTTRVLQKVWPELTETLIEELFAGADTDKDGCLSSDEFLELARKNREKWPAIGSLFV